MATFDVNSNTRKVQATANGTQTEFSFSFQVNATSDIKVFVDGVQKQESVNYDIKNSSNGAGLNADGTGKVVFITPPAATSTTYTVTVQNPGSGNKFYIGGVQQLALNLTEGNTYIFNYPSAHPFRFSSTADGTHGGGTEYTTGVTHNSSTQVTIVVPVGAPTLYYYCANHSGMGGTANTPSAGTDHRPTANQTVAIKSEVPKSRTSVYTAGGNITAASLEADFDTITMQLGDNAETLNRSVKAPVGDPDNIDMTMPTKANRLGTVLGFNATTGNPEAGPKIADVSTLAAITADIATLADIEDGTEATDAIQDVAAIKNQVQNVGNNVAAITNVNSNMAAVTTVSTNINDVITVANDLNEAISEIDTVAQDLQETTSEIDTVANNITNVNNVGNNIGNVNTIGGNATNLANVNTVGANLSGANTIGTVAGLNTQITALGPISADITTAAANVTDITNFADVYLGGYSSAPTTRNDGSALQIGDLYFHTQAGQQALKVFASGGFITAASAINGTANRFQFAISSSTTTLTGNDANGNTLAYDAGFVDVYLNGVKMVNGQDVTVTSGTSVVFASPIGLSGTDRVDIIAFGTFTLANFSINDANDVQTTGVADGDALIFNQSSGKFQPGAASSAEVYGFVLTDTNSDSIADKLQVTTTNGGADNITSSTYATFDDVVYAATGFTWSLNASGHLIATI